MLAPALVFSQGEGQPRIRAVERGATTADLDDGHAAPAKLLRRPGEDPPHETEAVATARERERRLVYSAGSVRMLAVQT